MFSQKYHHYWSSDQYPPGLDICHPTSISLQTATASVQALTQRYANNSGFVDGASNYAYCNDNTNSGLPVSSSTYSRYGDSYTCESLKDEFEKINEKHINRQSCKQSLADICDTYLYNSSHSNELGVNTSYSPTVKKCSILSKFYNADGSPIKSLWENEMSFKEQRTYKYDPKPLERRKNARSFVPNEKKTHEYWEQRKKNNLAARKSREDRRRKEIEILKCVDNLKSENIKLKVYAQKITGENQNLKYEMEMLKNL